MAMVTNHRASAILPIDIFILLISSVGFEYRSPTNQCLAKTVIFPALSKVTTE